MYDDDGKQKRIQVLCTCVTVGVCNMKKKLLELIKKLEFISEIALFVINGIIKTKLGNNHR